MLCDRFLRHPLSSAPTRPWAVSQNLGQKRQRADGMCEPRQGLDRQAVRAWHAVKHLLHILNAPVLTFDNRLSDIDAEQRA